MDRSITTATVTRSGFRQKIPENLLEWLGNDLFVSMIISSVDLASEASPTHLCLSASRKARVALLIYCYGRGIYGSYDVASLAENEGSLLKLFPNEAADWNEIRRFRRTHAEIIQHGLAMLLRRAWEAKNEHRNITRVNDSIITCDFTAPQFSTSFTPDFEREAEARIRQAIFYDSIALDD